MFIGTEQLTHIYMPGTPFATKALQDISFSFKQGEFALIIGPSGSGKSTLIQHLNGLLKPTDGKVIFEGKSIGKDKRDLLHLRRRIGLVFQMPEEQFFSETVFDEIAFAPRNQGLAETEVEKRVDGALEKIGLQGLDLKERHPFQLSAGQKRLVAIAAVLSINPEVLILDEPTVALDNTGRKNLFELLTELNREEGLTVIISTHHLDEAAALASSVLVLKQGELVMSGPAEDVFSERDQLYNLGLALPPVTEIMHGIFEKGFSVNTSVYTLQEARREINKLIRRDKP